MFVVMTVEMYLTLWLAEFVKASVRPNTYRSYEQLIRNHIIPALGAQTLHDLTALDVQRFLNESLRRGT